MSFPSSLRLRPRCAKPRPSFRPNLEVLEARTVPALLHVTSLADDGTAGTLRSVISTANTDADASNTIVFDVTGTIDLKLAPLNPTTGLFPGPTAFDVNKPLTIIGSGQTIKRDASAANFRFFFVEAAGNLSLSNLALEGGLALGGTSGQFEGAGGGAAGLGGAIFNLGTLNAQGVTFAGNAADGGAGGAFNPGEGGGGGLGGNANNATGGGPNGGAGGVGGSLQGGAGGFGGGGGGGGLTLAAGGTGGAGGAGGFGGGGGAGNFGPSFGGAGGAGGFGGGGGAGGNSNGGGFGTSGGAAGFGGGNGSGGQSGGGQSGAGGGGAGLGGAIFSVLGNVTIVDCTLFFNGAVGGAGGAGSATSAGGAAGSADGGAVFIFDSTLTIADSTFSNNFVTDGAGGHTLVAGRDVSAFADAGGTDRVVINNSILGQTDSSVSDFSAAVRGNGVVSSSGSNNLIRNPGPSGSAFNGSSSQADPLLAAAGLANNGGLTPTIALQANSPAINAGNNVLIPAGVSSDQRGPGFVRVYGSSVDIGAFESQPVVNTVVLETNGALEQFINGVGSPQSLSPAGTIKAVSTVENLSGQTVVFAITTGGSGPQYNNTLWENYSGVWYQLTDQTYTFQQISAATNASGEPVVFGVTTNQALYEDSQFNGVFPISPGGLDKGLTLLSPAGTIESVSAVTDQSGVVNCYAIVTTANNLWLNRSNVGWAQLSTGSFQQVSAGLNTAGQAVSYNVLSNSQLWEQNPTFGPIGLNTGFAMLSGMNNLPSSFLSVTAGGPDKVFAIAADETVWEHNPAGNTHVSAAFTATQLSATQSAAGADEAFLTLTDGSFWEYSTALPSADPFEELLTSGAASSSTPA